MGSPLMRDGSVIARNTLEIKLTEIYGFVE